MTLVRDRADYAVLRGTISDVGADSVEVMTAPVGFGDYDLLEWQAQFTAIATLVATPELLSAAMWVVDNGGAGVVVDFGGIGRWLKHGTGIVATRSRPLRPVFVGSPDALFFTSPELDTNVSPTGDFNVYVRVRRLRNLGL